MAIKISIKSANRLYMSEKYNDALEMYLQLEKELPELAHIISFNRDLCFMKLGINKELCISSKNMDNSKTYKELKDLAIKYRRRLEYKVSIEYWLRCAQVVAEDELKDFFENLKKNIEYFIQHEEFSILLQLTKQLSIQWPENRLFLQAYAISLLKLNLVNEATTVWQMYWDKAVLSKSFTKQTSIKFNNASYNDSVFDEFTLKHKSNIIDNKKICIYTALFGDYDKLNMPLIIPKGIKMICFSDRKRNISGWEVVVVETYNDNPVLSNRKYKILPHKFLSDYDYSMYIDANIYITGNLKKLIANLLYEDFVAWKHPERSDIYSELIAIMSNFRHRPKEMLEQYKFFKKENVPNYTGMIEACFLWRCHNNIKVNKLMEEWWEFTRKNGNRDQPPLTYLMWKMNTRPKVFSSKYGNSRKNDFFVKMTHQMSPLDKEKKD